ncbi:hypothetical protein ACIF8W_02430 [Streptomyces sp. NPDC085639]|uniref:hypothetical protein n=1 Tax=Streptomyces sp. NPDC085639 TaxID=3365734 RepID=UPI0037D84396
MTSTRRTDHDRVRQQADDPDPRWPLRGDLAYDTATSRTGVVIDVPGDTGTTVYRLCPEGGGENGWNASLDTLVPTEDAPLRSPAGLPEARCRTDPNTPRGDLHRFLTAYLDQQRSFLAGTAPDHARALELISDGGLRNRLAAAHRQALAL